MRKFIIDGKDTDSAHFTHCSQQKLPFIRITLGRRYAQVEFDVYEMVKPKGLPGEQPCELVAALYQGYAQLVGLPPRHISCVGGSNSLDMKVYREHAETIAALLYDYLLRFIVTEQKRHAIQ